MRASIFAFFIVILEFPVRDSSSPWQNLFCDHYNLYNYRMLMIGIPFSQSTFRDTTIFGHMIISMGALRSEMDESSGIIWLRLPVFT